MRIIMKVYVSKESKKEETKSTAYSFLLVSVFGFIALILFATGVLPVHVADYMKIMLCIVMGVMLLIFFVIGIVSLRQLKTLGTQAEKENDFRNERLRRRVYTAPVQDMLYGFPNIPADYISYDKEDDRLYEIDALGKSKHFQIFHKFGSNADFIGHYFGHCIWFHDCILSSN